MGTGSKKGNAAVAVATFLGDGPESRIVDIPLNERWGARGEIEPVRTLEERLLPRFESYPRSYHCFLCIGGTICFPVGLKIAAMCSCQPDRSPGRRSQISASTLPSLRARSNPLLLASSSLVSCLSSLASSIFKSRPRSLMPPPQESKKVSTFGPQGVNGTNG